MDWFDGHLDLAYLALEERDMAKPLALAKTGPQPAAVTLSSLCAGQVRWAMGTIFPVPRVYAEYGYPPGDIAAAHAQGKLQLAQYHAWEAAGLIEIVRDRSQLVAAADLGRRPAGQGDGDDEGLDLRTRPLQVVILMEGAAPIQTPEEVRWWYAQGVRLVGLSWAVGTQYAGGNHSKGPITEAGRALVAEMDALGMIHDLSHLSDEAAWQLLEMTRGPVVATHSNCRALLDGKDQRHLPDALIQAIGERDGIIGLNLLSRFLTLEGTKRRATITEAIAHVEHICGLLGHRRAVGLGSDMDGGFGANQLPASIDRPFDFDALLSALPPDWRDDERAGFAHANWLRFLDRALVSSLT